MEEPSEAFAVLPLSVTEQAATLVGVCGLFLKLTNQSRGTNKLTQAFRPEQS